MQHGYIIALTTASTEEQARTMARSIIESKLGACVHIDPIHSVYHWQGELREEPEWRLTIKTTAGRYAELEEHIKTHHTYQTPEIIRIEIAGGIREYLDWIDASVR